MERDTYIEPVRRIPTTAHLLARDRCSPTTTGIGMIRIITSENMFVRAPT